MKIKLRYRCRCGKSLNAGNYFCSKTCEGVFRRGKPSPKPEGWRENLSRAKIGVPNPLLAAALRGRTQAPEHVEKNSKAQLARYDRVGRVSLRDSKQFHDWRDSVLFKFNYTCQHCGITEDQWKQKQIAEGLKLIRGLEAHHIKDWDNHADLRFDVENGLALCRICHALEEQRLIRVKHSYQNKRVYLYLPIKSMTWLAMILRMGRTVEILHPGREYRNFKTKI